MLDRLCWVVGLHFCTSQRSCSSNNLFRTVGFYLIACWSFYVSLIACPLTNIDNQYLIRLTSMLQTPQNIFLQIYNYTLYWYEIFICWFILLCLIIPGSYLHDYTIHYSVDNSDLGRCRNYKTMPSLIFCSLRTPVQITTDTLINSSSNSITNSSL